MFSGGESEGLLDSAARPNESPADNGTLTLWDYATGLPFQHLKDIPQPGSLDAEAVSAFLLIAFRLTMGFCRAYSARRLTRLARG